MSPDYYLAVKDGAGFEIRSAEQFDQLLEDGYSIVRVRDDEETTIATPQTGFLEERPVFSMTRTCSAAGAGDGLAEALSIILYGEEAEHGDTDAGA